MVTRVRIGKFGFVAASLGLVLYLATLASQRGQNPGALSIAHAADLSSPSDCNACHGNGSTSMRSACARCHHEIEEQLVQGRGLHGTTKGSDACALCHSEHKGSELNLVGERAFLLAGVDRERYDHRHVAFELDGRHLELNCRACHPNAEADIRPDDEPRFLGLSQDCSNCHDDPHEGRFTRSCAECHGQSKPFAAVASFAHTMEFPLEGGHAHVDCARCHEPGSPWALERVGGFDPPPTIRSCSACHSHSHGERFLDGIADELSVSAEATCAHCHTAKESTFSYAGLTAELHAAGGFPLTEPHARLECASCHEHGYKAVDIPRKAQDCAACHDDPHERQFLADDETPRRCVECHALENFAPHQFDLELHARTAFPLLGAHATTDCHACHSMPAEQPRRFAGTSTSCASCHVDAHFGRFGESADCARCHRSQSFREHAQTHFDHERDAGFALLGAHAGLQCAGCHDEPVTAPAVRELGRAPQHTNGSLACATCHTDVHGGRFAVDSVGRATDCATCHVETDFRDVAPERFDHGAWTSFVLEGAHRTAACVTCHPRSLERPERHLGPALGDASHRCASCHEDVHSGQFASADDCGLCHGTETFAPLEKPFDHGRWTDFSLEGAHAEVRCATCHPRFEPPDALGRGFMAAPGRDCTSCHVDPHADQFANAGFTDCSRCHAADASFEPSLFDHDRDSRFALDERHKQLECSACHLPWETGSGNVVIRYKPLGVECADCHGPPRRSR